MKKMNELELKEFNFIGERMLNLYHKAPQNGSKRKIIAACDDNNLGNIIMFFQGSKEDALAVQEFLNNLPRK